MTFARHREVYDRSPFPANPLTAMCDVSVQLKATASHQGSWVIATQRETPEDHAISSQILGALTERGYPFFRTIDSVQAGFDVFLSTPQDGLSDLASLETKIAFLLALERRPEAGAEVRDVLKDRPPDADDPFAESIREMARRHGLL